MSDPNSRIAEWRSSLEPGLGAQAMDELEDHLRSIVDSLASTGLSEQERLTVALHRLGKSKTLASEFGKNGFRSYRCDRLLSLALGMLLLNLLLIGMQYVEWQILFRYKGMSPATAVPLLTLAAGMMVVTAAYIARRTARRPLGQLFHTRLPQPLASLVCLLVLLGITVFFGQMPFPLYNPLIGSSGETLWRATKPIHDVLFTGIWRKACLGSSIAFFLVWLISARGHTQENPVFNE